MFWSLRLFMPFFSFFLSFLLPHSCLSPPHPEPHPPPPSPPPPTHPHTPKRGRVLSDVNLLPGISGLSFVSHFLFCSLVLMPIVHLLFLFFSFFFFSFFLFSFLSCHCFWLMIHSPDLLTETFPTHFVRRQAFLYGSC